MKPGDIILEEEPLCHVLLQSQKGTRCDRCFFSEKGLKKCTGCKSMFYCDRTCQKRDWIIHKTECQCLKKISPKVPVDSVRILLRLIISLHLELPMNSPFSRKFDDFLSHKDEIRADEKRSAQFTQVAFTLKEYASDIIPLPPATVLFDMFCKMMINSFTICDEALNHVGTGIYLSGSMFDHSCSPNAVPTFVGNTLVVRAITDIVDPSPNKVYISYIEQLYTTEERQKQLLEQYYFICHCDRCKDEEQNQQMQSIFCPVCKQHVYMNLDSGQGCTCQSCGISANSTHLQNINKQLKKCLELLALPDSHTSEDPKTFLDLCNTCLKDIQGTLPLSNVYHVRLLDKALLAAIDMKDWDKALEYGCKTLDSYRTHYRGLSLNYAIQLFKVGKLQLFQQKLNEALSNLCQAESILLTIYKQDWKKNQMCQDLKSLIHQCEEELRLNL